MVTHIVQSGTAYSQIKNRTVICFCKGDGAKTGQPVSRSLTKWKDTDKGTKPYGEIIYVNVRENKGNDPIAVLNRDLVQKDYRKIVNPVLRESCRRTKEGDRKEIMCDKIRQLQAETREETRKEERARAAKREKKLKKELKKANMLAEEKKKEAERANMLAEDQKKEIEEAQKEAERLKKEVEVAALKVEQVTTESHLKGMIEAHIPVESICAVLHMSVDAVRKQASLLGCVL